MLPKQTFSTSESPCQHRAAATKKSSNIGKRTVNTAYLEQKLAFANRRYDLLSRTVMNLLEELAAREDDDLR